MTLGCHKPKADSNARMKAEGGRMKGMLLVLDSFYFILPPSAFILFLVFSQSLPEKLPR
jgi:hypothetical protein